VRRADVQADFLSEKSRVCFPCRFARALAFLAAAFAMALPLLCLLSGWRFSPLK
jgi:hypothetical protein